MFNELEQNPITPEYESPIQEDDGERKSKIPSPKSIPIDYAISKYAFTNKSDFHRGPYKPGRGYALVAWSFAAALIDTLILISLTSFFTLSLHLITRIKFIEIKNLIMQNPDIFALLMLAFVFFYMSTLRVFMGHSIGEWACGLRLGPAKQRLQKNYGLRVCLRSVLVLFSGMLFFPIVSALLGRDVLGLLLGLPLVQLK